MRSGTYKNTRLWIEWNPGHGYRKDLFLTDQNKNLISIEATDLVKALPSEVITNINEFLRKEDINESTNT